MGSEQVLEILADFLNAVEAVAVKAKREISELVGVQTWDPNKIKWTQTEGASGPYERSEDVNNLEFKGMLKDLAAHGGKLTRGGYFMWIFKNGSTVGRKKLGKAPEAKPEKITQLFLEDLRSMLSFEEKADQFIIKPRQFLGAENFAKIAGIVKKHGGEYISAGKNSRFRIPKTAVK